MGGGAREGVRAQGDVLPFVAGGGGGALRARVSDPGCRDRRPCRADLPVMGRRAGAGGAPDGRLRRMLLPFDQQQPHVSNERVPLMRYGGERVAGVCRGLLWQHLIRVDEAGLLREGGDVAQDGLDQRA